MATKCITAETLGLDEYVIRMGCFNFDIVLIVGPYAGACRYIDLKHGYPRDFGQEPEGMHCSKGVGESIVWLPRPPQTPREHGTLAHEFLHAVRLMFDEWAQMPLNKQSQEAWCHALAHCVEEAHMLMLVNQSKKRERRNGCKLRRSNAKRAKKH